nr:hypothetical protein BaRGS_032235 [Batillaria attramentaria]
MRSLLFCFLGTLFVLSDEVEGRWVQGNIETEQTKSNWEFIARFCFLSQFGSLLYEFEYPVVSGLSLSYKLHMTNGEKWDLLHYEYSADEFLVLRSRQLFHSTYKLYMVSLILWFFGLLLMSIAWGLYGDSGWQEKDTEVTGRISQAASTIIFILMLILMAKGYSITRGRLPQPSTIKIIVFFVLFVIVYITLFIWEGLFFDEGFVLYFYESPPGYGLITMRLIGWLWFLYAVFFTLKHNSNKANFYFPFFIFYTLW